MKKNPFKDFETNFYHGKCGTCSETYEAQSQTDDLEGITFECKKVVCKGRVTLTLNLQKSNPNSADVSEGKPGSNPPRFC